MTASHAAPTIIDAPTIIVDAPTIIADALPNRDRG